jgi:predicted metal-dependent peptidase
MERMLGELLEPVIDWRTKLHAYITNEIPVDFSMRTPSRRFLSTGVYTPQVIKENLELMVGVDLSGSISDDEYKEFMAEVVGIANSYTQVKMRVIGWACSVDERDDIEVTQMTKDRLLDAKFFGGGGTHFGCYTDYVRRKEYKSRLHVVLTDGYIEGEPDMPAGDVLWVLSRNGSSEIVKHTDGQVTSLNDVKR